MRRRLSTYLFSAGALGPLLMCSFATRTQSQAEQEKVIQFLAAGVQDAREQARYGCATLTRTTFLPKRYFEKQAVLAQENPLLSPDEKVAALRNFSPTDRETTRAAQFHHQPPKLSISMQEDPKTSQNLRAKHIVVDAERAFSLDQYDENKGQSKKPNDKSGFYSFGYIFPREDVFKNGIAKGFVSFDPRSYAYFDFPGGSPLDQAFLNPQRKVTYKGEDTLENSRCMKVEVAYDENFNKLFWIDVEHGFILRRLEERVRVNNEMLLDRETHVPRIQKSKGVWLPAIYETRQFLDPVKAEPGQSPKVDPASVVFTRVTISDFKADCDIPAETFVMKWPKGTNVRNQITQQGFVAGTDEKKKTEAQTDKNGAATQPSTKPSNGTEQPAKE